MAPVTRQQIQARVSDVLQNALGVEAVDITLDSSIDTDLGADELDRVEIVMDLEDAFDFAIDEEEADEWRHVRDIVGYIQREVGC